MRKTGNLNLKEKHWCKLKVRRSLPFSSWRSWQGCLRCSWVFPPQWRPSPSGTFPGRGHMEGHSWGQQAGQREHNYMGAPKEITWEKWNEKNKTKQKRPKNLLCLLLESLSQVFESALWWHQLLQLVDYSLCLEDGEGQKCYCQWLEM